MSFKIEILDKDKQVLATLHDIRNPKLGFLTGFATGVADKDGKAEFYIFHDTSKNYSLGNAIYDSPVLKKGNDISLGPIEIHNLRANE